MRPDDIRNVLVVGAGTMGGQIALQCAMHGLDVALYDVSADALSRGMERVRGYVAYLNSQGRISPNTLDRIRPTTDLAAAAAEAEAAVRRGGLSDEVVDDIRRRILGIAG